MAKIGIVICNYNKQNDVIDCIQSVLESKYEDYHIYVVDNASTDESVRLIRECYGSCDRLTLIENSENLGALVDSIQGFAWRWLRDTCI